MNEDMTKDQVRKLPVLDSVRFKRKYRGKDIYINISYYNGRFVEMFAKFATEGEIDNRYMESGWDCLTRIVSVADIDIDTMIKHMDRSSRLSDDLPALISSVLKEFKQMNV